MEENIDLDTYDPKETEAIVNSLMRHVADPNQKQEGEANIDENKVLANKLLSLAGQ